MKAQELMRPPSEMKMLHSKFCSCAFVVLSSIMSLVAACDVDDGASLEIEEPPIRMEEEELYAAFDWERVPPPAAADGSVTAFQGDAPSAAAGSLTVETFQFSASDFIALSMAPGGLFAPYPSGVSAMPPELSSSFLVGFTFYDEHDQVVGFGTEQEVLNFDEATGQTTYTLTIPGRGTLMLSQEEEFAYLLEEVADMVATQEFVRSYDPPLVNIHTVPGSGRVIGGTGEFAQAKGLMREYSIVRQLDLTTGYHDVGIIVQVAYL
jgi:hypothetical protein